jgi:hypothetical protein
MKSLTALQKEAREEYWSMPNIDVNQFDQFLDTLTRKAFISGIEAARAEKPHFNEYRPGDAFTDGWNECRQELDKNISTLLASLTEV